MNEQKAGALNYFDRAMGTLHDLPDVVRSKPTTLRVVPPFGLGSHVYVVQTFRQREVGDSIFLEHVSEGDTVRLVIPPAVADVIARQRDQLTTKVRSRAGKRIAEDLRERGIRPGFLKQA
jgi:hypothetical protein